MSRVIKHFADAKMDRILYYSKRFYLFLCDSIVGDSEYHGMFIAKTSHFLGCIDMVETSELSDVNQHTENTPFTMVFLQTTYD